MLDQPPCRTRTTKKLCCIASTARQVCWIRMHWLARHPPRWTIEKTATLLVPSGLQWSRRMDRHTWLSLKPESSRRMVRPRHSLLSRRDLSPHGVLLATVAALFLSISTSLLETLSPTVNEHPVGSTFRSTKHTFGSPMLWRAPFPPIVSIKEALRLWSKSRPRELLFLWDCRPKSPLPARTALSTCNAVTTVNICINSMVLREPLGSTKLTTMEVLI